MTDSFPPPGFQAAVRQFNRHEFFECHETLEELWLEDRRPIRRFYQGILQVGVGFYHLQRKNHHGAVSLLRKGIEKLRDFPSNCLGIDAGRLTAEARLCLHDLLSLGPARLDEFDPGKIPSIHIL